MQETQTPEFKRTLVIDRTKWYRGTTNPSLDARLVDNKGTMCCLGFECVACGIDPKTLRGVPMPQNVRGEDRSKISHLLDVKGRNNEFSSRAASLNDLKLGQTIEDGDFTDVFTDEEDQTLLETESQREALIAAEFATQGIKVEFIN